MYIPIHARFITIFGKLANETESSGQWCCINSIYQEILHYFKINCLFFSRCQSEAF